MREFKARRVAAQAVLILVPSKKPPHSQQHLRPRRPGDASPVTAGSTAAAAEAVEGLSGPGPTGGEPKRRRVEEPHISHSAAAQEWMCSTFGAEWRARLHRTHRLSLAKPLVFCRRRGYHCEGPRHLAKLRELCREPKQGSVQVTRLKRILRGEDPLKGSRRLAAAVPLPFGTLS